MRACTHGLTWLNDFAYTAGMSEATQRPRHCLDMFITFTWLGLQGFGGVLSVVQRELVERKQWLSQAAFAEDWALAQTLPGPNVVNLAVMLGERHFGLRGALVSASGLLLVPGLLMIAVVFGFQSLTHMPWANSALRGMGVSVAGMVMASAWRFFPLLRRHLLGGPLAFFFTALSAVMASVWHWPLWQVIGSVGVVSCLLCAKAIQGKSTP